MTATKIKGYTPSDSREILRLAYRVDQRISSKLQQAEALRTLAGQARGLATQAGKPFATGVDGKLATSLATGFAVDRPTDMEPESSVDRAAALASHRTTSPLRADIATDGPEEAEKPGNLKDALTKLAELEAEIATDISQLIDKKREIQELIRSLPSPEQQLLLELKYLHFRTWQDVADTMNYSYRQIQRLHQQILRRLDKNQRAG